MQHRKLLITLCMLLAVSAGGVFFLVNKESSDSIVNETLFVAGVGIVDESEILEEGLAKEIKEETEKIQNKEVSLSSSQPVAVNQKKEKVEIEPVGLHEVQEEQEIQVDEPKDIENEEELTEDASEASEPEQEQSVLTVPLEPVESAQNQLININTAGLEELDLIAGVGPAIGQRIIDYRNTVGLFKTIEEIKNVQGIGDITYEKMKDQIMVGDVSIEEEESLPVPTVPSEPIEPEPKEEEQPEPEPPAPTVPSEPAEEIPTKININTAGFEGLQEITGVGPVIAQKIINYRNESGLFQNIEDLKNVKGIGDVSFEKMRDEISI